MSFPLDNVGVSILAHGEGPYLADILRWLEPRVRYIHVLEDQHPMFGEQDEAYKVTQECVRVSQVKNVIFEVGDFGKNKGQEQERDRRAYSSKVLGQRGCEWVWVMDADEVYDDAGAVRLWEYFLYHANRNPRVAGAAIGMYTYWRSLRYRVEPRETLRTPAIVKVAGTEYWGGRDIRVRSSYVQIPDDVCVMRHYSWAHSPMEARQKVGSWGHANQMIPGWMENVFLKWTPGCGMMNVHPTEPVAYKSIIRCELPVPECLASNPRVNQEVIGD